MSYYQVERVPTKVRVIVTKFVQVDAGEFKSVVQCLTGKDSVVAEAPESWNGHSEASNVVDRSCRRGGGKWVTLGDHEVQKEDEGGVEMRPTMDELF
ncbi:VQ domain containing protein [Musa troglodytarum]|uniref:VQ domain containing protein n=1 Tax=Musa troglodytarum TaxID=320322 RepID=A0A9E7HXQ6_9LILI|nr:VQ domain containing protein [Musa troglodytarum]